ncbi:PQQ-like domain-containing protein [Streptomyces sp. Ncost-T6T-1]|nr:PQQ-like domain-containing protein [Streptomyces sp. Ncost-T6T-1]
MRILRRGLAGLLVVGVLAVAGCGSGEPESGAPKDAKGDGSASGKPAKPVETPELTEYQAPVKFTSEPVGDPFGRTGPLPTSTLAGRFLFTMDIEGVQVRDVATGKPTGPQLTPRNSVKRVFPDDYFRNVDREDSLAPYVLERTDGDPLVLVPYHVSKEGQGTTASRHFVELLVIDSGTGKLRTSLELPLSEGFRSGATAARVVGAHDGTVAVTARVHAQRSSANETRTTFGVDLGDPDRPRSVWEEQGFEAYAVAGGNAVGATPDAGLRYNVLTAVGMKDGETAWQDASHKRTANLNPEIQAQWVTPAGPDRIITTKVKGGLFASSSRLVLVDARTGKEKPVADKTRAVECRYDEKSVVVCWRRPGATGGAHQVFALDAPSGELLWQLPDEAAGRIAPTVTAVRHGRVYASTGSGPVVLDARGGEDVELQPGVVPVAVNEYAALAAVRKTGSGSGSRAAGDLWEMTLHHARG